LDHPRRPAEGVRVVGEVGKTRQRRLHLLQQGNALLVATKQLATKFLVSRSTGDRRLSKALPVRDPSD
jgi:hypothetical protein